MSVFFIVPIAFGIKNAHKPTQIEDSVIEVFETDPKPETEESIVETDEMTNQITASETPDMPDNTEEGNEESQEIVYTTEDIPKTTYYPTLDLNCRISPDVNSERITTFSRNAMLTATKKSDAGWYYVSNGTYEGWCNGYYLSTSKPAPKSTNANNTTLTTSQTRNNGAVFKLTAYCACSKCCGKWANGITATGTTATQGRTIAVCPSQIPLGSTVYIEGYGTYVAEDTGVGYGVIDVYFNSHTEALNFGVRYATVTW